MPRFSFEAINLAGSPVRGTLDAPSRSLALDQLLATGQTPIALRDVSDAGNAIDRLLRILRLRHFDHLLFLRELSLLLNAGLPVERALLVLQSLSPNASHALRLRLLIDHVRGGQPLSQAIATVVREAPRHLSRLIAAGEASGRLAEVVTRLAAGLGRAKLLRDKLISGLTYPAVLAATMAVVLYVVFTSVLPRLAPIFKTAGASLPFATGLLLAVGAFLQNYGQALLFLVASGIAAAGYCWRRPDLRLHIDRFVMTSRILLGLPNSYESARYCRNLQTLLEGGLPLDRALAAAQDATVNSAFRARMADVRRDVAEGQLLRKAFASSKMLPAVVVEFAAVGEETGRLGAMIGEAADILDQDVERRLDRLSSLVLPAATLIMGGLVAAIMTGIVTGILAVNDLVR